MPKHWTNVVGVRSLIWNRKGVSTLEFALVGPLFVFLACAIVDFGLEMLTQMVLDQAVTDASRNIQIGNTTSSQAFVTDLCGHVSALIVACSSSVQVHVASGTSFSGLASATVGAGGTLSPATFSAGTAGSSMLVQVAYKHSYLVGLVGAAAGSSYATLLSTEAFQNEPY